MKNLAILAVLVLFTPKAFAGCWATKATPEGVKEVGRVSGTDSRLPLDDGKMAVIGSDEVHASYSIWITTPSEYQSNQEGVNQHKVRMRLKTRSASSRFGRGPVSQVALDGYKIFCESQFFGTMSAPTKKISGKKKRQQNFAASETVEQADGNASHESGIQPVQAAEIQEKQQAPVTQTNATL